MKRFRFISIITVLAMLLCSVSLTTFAGNEDYTTLYLEFARDAQTNPANPLNEGVGAAVMMDFDKNSVPELLLLRTYTVHKDADGKIIPSGDPGYDTAPVKQREYAIHKGFAIVNGAVSENSPWNTGAYAVTLGMRCLPGEAPIGDEFTGTYLSSAGANSLVMYHIPIFGVPAYTALSYDSNGFNYYTDVNKEEFFKVYSEIDIPVASVCFSDLTTTNNSAYKAIEYLCNEYKKACGNAPESESYNVSDWAEAEVNKAKELNLIPSEMLNSDLTKNITRAEFAAVAMKVYEVVSNRDYNRNVGEIGDISGDVYEAYIKKAYKLGITSGVGSDKNGKVLFSPELSITREQLATMLCRTVKLAKFGEKYFDETADLSLDITGAPEFADGSFIAEYAAESVSYMSKHGIIKGVDSSNFAPKNTATREQAILLALRIINSADTLIGM